MRGWLWRIAKWFLFRIEAESAHRLMVSLIRLGMLFRGLPLRIASGAPAARPLALPLRGVQVFGMEFLSRVGLAAGFDKDAEIVRALPALGFGFAEIGTVTPRPQPGNDRPRLFRDPARRAIFNRMGFNGLGATIVADRLAKARPWLPGGFRVGVNVGKNKDTPLEESARDYVRAAAAFEGLADYLVINVSSPNTPGLRALQEASALSPIVQEVNHLISGWKRRPPLLLKLAPEVKGDDLAGLIRSVEAWGIDGWVLTNTLAGSLGKLQGGWSGAPLTGESDARLSEARALTKLPIISVGGILGADEAKARRDAGADLIQIYSGWIFNGPSFPELLRKTLENRP